MATDGGDANSGTAAPFKTVAGTPASRPNPGLCTALYVRGGNDSERPRVVDNVRFINGTDAGPARTGLP